MAPSARPETFMQRLPGMMRKGWFVIAATLLMTAQPFLTSVTKNGSGDYDYSFVAVSFIAELVKLFISLGMYLQPSTRRSHNLLLRNDVLRFAIPAFVYFINNNLVFYILKYVTSTTFQILSSLKTVATGILFRVILKRVLDDVQRTAILLLACGAATSQFPVCHEVNCTEVIAISANATDVPLLPSGGAKYIGAMLALITCFNSAFGGVYSELLLKKDGQIHSIHLQNIVLYGWGVLFNGLGMVSKDHAHLRAHGLFGGFTFAVWILVCNNSLSGLMISAILKFTDNIVRVFAHTAAMCLTMVLDLLFMSAPLTPQMFVSITVVSCSTYLYNLKPAPPKSAATRAMQPLNEDEEKFNESLPETPAPPPTADEVSSRAPLRPAGFGDVEESGTKGSSGLD